MNSKLFVLTTHAKEKIIERGISLPHECPMLKIAREKFKRKLRKSCGKQGYNNSNYVYWVDEIPKEPICYVCSSLGKSKYLVVTAFVII